MSAILTKSTTPILGQIAWVLGYLINGIYWCLEQIGMPNIALAIILFTVIMYLVMTPMQVKQQKFSKLNSVMMPEIQAIQKKYKGKKDQQSQMAMQQESSAVHAKYGVSPIGGCGQLLIQLPVMMALWQVINHIPGYVSSIKNIFIELVDKIAGVAGHSEIVQGFMDENKIRTLKLILDERGIVLKDSVIDLLYKLNPDQWANLAEVDKFSDFSDTISGTADKVAHVSNFLGMNISDNPLAIIQRGWADKAFLLIFAAAMIPILAWFTQWVNAKLTPQAKANDSDGPSTMENSMKSVNVIMPLFSAFMCVTLPVGVGIYWIAGAVVRGIQQLIINRHLEKKGVDQIIKESQEKANKKAQKKGKISSQSILQQAQVNARKAGNDATEENKTVAPTTNTGNVKKGSLASRANMVKNLDDRNKKK